MMFDVFDAGTDKRLGEVEAEDEDRAVEIWCESHTDQDVWAHEQEEEESEEGEDSFN